MIKNLFGVSLLLFVVFGHAAGQVGNGSQVGRSQVAVSADLEMYLSMTLEATDIYFHIADNAQELLAEIDGQICSNNGQYLFISSDLDATAVTELTFKQDIFGRSAPVFDPIPCQWFLRDECDGSFRPGQYSGSGNNGQTLGITWLRCGVAPCCHTFMIRIALTPAPHQPGGRYEI